ncbi:GAF domain-containing protein [Rhodococcus koreensis]
MSREWQLVETSGIDEHRLVAEGRDKKGWRKLSSVHRGPALSAVNSLIGECIEKADVVTTTITNDKALEKLGPAAIAVPVLGGDRKTVVAVQFYSGSPTQQHPERPDVGVWEWEVDVEDAPPRLHMSKELLDLFGVNSAHRDRTIYGPADFFTRVERIGDIARYLRTLYEPPRDDGTNDGAMVIRRDSGEHCELRYAERRLKTPAGERLRGLCWDTGEDARGVYESMLDSHLASTLAGLHGMFGIIGDIRFPKAPYIVKWLTPRVPGIGHGVSTGQTPALHPDDFPRILQWMEDVRKGPVEGKVRARRGGGGWLEMQFKGYLLDPAVSDVLGTALVYPDSIEHIED